MYAVLLANSYNLNIKHLRSKSISRIGYSGYTGYSRGVGPTFEDINNSLVTIVKCWYFISTPLFINNYFINIIIMLFEIPLPFKTQK